MVTFSINNKDIDYTKMRMKINIKRGSKEIGRKIISNIKWNKIK